MNRSIQEITELFAPRRMAQLAQRFGLDLADALARDVKFLADLLERMRLAVDQTEAHAKHLLFARVSVESTSSSCSRSSV